MISDPNAVAVRPWTIWHIIAGIGVILGIVLLSVRVFTRPGSQNTLTRVAITPMSIRHPEILVEGWSTAELQTIINDFSHQYGLSPASNIRIQLTSTNIQKVTFFVDCEPRRFFFLINYINYPKGFDLAHRTINVAGKADILFESPHSGQSARTEERAIVYVPEHDREYDVVYVRFVSGNTYRVPFTTLKWQRTEEERMSNTVKTLSTQ